MTKKIIDELNTVGGAPDPRFMTPEEQNAHIAAAKRVIDGFKELEPIFEKHRKLLALKRQGKNYKL